MQTKPVTICAILSSAAFLVIAAFFIWQPAYVGENCAMYLDCARLLLSGQRQYVDFIDLNPPMITYLACIPVIVSSLLKLPLVATFHVMVLMAVSLSWALTLRFCLRLYRKSPDDAYLLLPFALALSNLPLLFCFGERDHLITLAFVPFFVCRLLVYQKPILRGAHWELALVGLGAGLAIALKPQCALILLFTESYFIATATKKKPVLSLDLLFLALPIVIYGLHFIFLPPAVKDAYFGWLLPLMTRYYTAFNVPFWRAATLYTYFGPLLRSLGAFVALIGLAFLGRKRSKLCYPLIFFAAGAYIVYLLQSKGWGYQTIPALTACFLLSAAVIPICLRVLLDWSNISLSINQKILVESALLIALCPCFALDSSLTGKELNDCDQWINQYTRAGDSVLIMSSAVSPAYPSLLLSNRKNGSRYLWSAPLVMLAFGRQTGDNQADLDYIESQEHTVLERLEQDIHERKPKLVMIEYYPAIGPNLFALVARRGLLQNDLSAYKRLGICNRFVGFLYQGAPQSPLIGTQSDLTVKPGKDSPKNSNNPAQMPDLNFGEGRVEQFRLASATIARADRTILLNPTGEAYLSRGRAYASISMHQQAVSNFERAKGYSGPSAKEADIAIRQDPEIPAGYLERAWNFNQQKRFKEALQLADLAIKKDYALVDAHLCRASALRGLHEPAAASEQIIADCLRGSKE